MWQPKDDSMVILQCLICLFKCVLICLFLKSSHSKPYLSNRLKSLVYFESLTDLCQFIHALESGIDI